MQAVNDVQKVLKYSSFNLKLLLLNQIDLIKIESVLSSSRIFHLISVPLLRNYRDCVE